MRQSSRKESTRGRGERAFSKTPHSWLAKTSDHVLGMQHRHVLGMQHRPCRASHAAGVHMVIRQMVISHSARQPLQSLQSGGAVARSRCRSCLHAMHSSSARALQCGGGTQDTAPLAGGTPPESQKSKSTASSSASRTSARVRTRGGSRQALACSNPPRMSAALQPPRP